MLFYVDVLPVFGHYCRPVSILNSDMFYSCFKIMFASMIRFTMVNNNERYNYNLTLIM